MVLLSQINKDHYKPPTNYSLKADRCFVLCARSWVFCTLKTMMQMFHNYPSCHIFRSHGHSHVILSPSLVICHLFSSRGISCIIVGRKKSIASLSMHMKIKKHLIINNGEILKFKWKRSSDQINVSIVSNQACDYRCIFKPILEEILLIFALNCPNLNQHTCIWIMMHDIFDIFYIAFYVNL
jgi:hypothetical protein